MGTVEPQVAGNALTQTIDGFQLVIDALKLNGVDTIYGLPGIPITDLTRRAQADGMRVLSFRHEQSAGYAASIAGFLTQKPGIRRRPAARKSAPPKRIARAYRGAAPLPSTSAGKGCLFFPPGSLFRNRIAHRPRPCRG